MQLNDVILYLPVLLFSVVLHEFAHGWQALREGDDLRTVLDRQTVGLFPRATWLHLLREVGFDPEVVEDPSGEGERLELFACRKP